MRNKDGTFADGNSGGPGRPRRLVEKNYLRMLSDCCPLEAWQKICARAVDDAEAGDGKSREWLARYLCGNAQLWHDLTDKETAARMVEDM